MQTILLSYKYAIVSSAFNKLNREKFENTQVDENILYKQVCNYCCSELLIKQQNNKNLQGLNLDLFLRD